MIKGAKKEDLRLTAIELGETITDSMTVIELSNVIKNNEQFIKDPDSVNLLLTNIIEDRKLEEKKVENNKQNELELEKIKLEKAKAELELIRLRTDFQNVKFSETENQTEKCDSLDSLVKSIRTLTIKIPSKPEGWGFFFSSLERAFLAKSVPDKFKAEILLNLLGEKSANVLIYVKDDELNDYEKVKSIVLREFEPTAQSCLEHFRKTSRQANESHVQFSSRLSTSLDYYLSLRKVIDFESLKQLLVSDKLYQTLDKETASHISVRQGDSWYKPIELGKEVDLYFTSRGKSLVESPNTYKNSATRNVSKVFISDIKGSKCALCNENHPLYKCSNYKALSVNDRLEVVKKNNLCFNCLSGSSHKVGTCKSKYSCSICKRRHHISLHFPQEQNETKQKIAYENTIAPVHVNKKEEYQSQSLLSPLAGQFAPSNCGASSFHSQNNFESFAATNASNCLSKTVLLSTAICFLIDEFENVHKVRCLLDVGSESNFITTDCVNRLGLKKDKINIMVSGINGLSMTIKSRVSTSISNQARNFQTELDFLVVPKITDFTPSKTLKVFFQGMNNVQLADEDFNVPGVIDLLLGAEIFYELLVPGQIYPSNSKLVLQNTVFGYVVSGSVLATNNGSIHCGLVKDATDLNKILESFWEIENIEPVVIQNKELEICEEHFAKNHMRDDTGRYVVQMPLKDEPRCLGKSRDIALKKLNSLWNRIIKEPEYLSLYRDFLNEYKTLGHMHEVIEGEEQEGSYYIPHLGVYHPEKSSTKLRVVFNASSPTTKGNSLNSLQYNGGVIQEDLFSIMVRFRKHIIAFIADIEKMYRMISIHPCQRKLQKILWKDGINEPVKTYELATVTYGTVSAPYLAMRTLKQLSIDEEANFQLAAPLLRNDFYMDDVLSGADTLSTARELRYQLIEILKKGGMNLHKWCSNCPELAVNTEKDYQFSNPEETKVLGVFWKPASDCLSFKVKLNPNPPYTKRDVLSTIARIFDPLGLIGPVVTKAKIFLQKLWMLKIDWSDPLPTKQSEEWQSFVESLESINNIDFGRCILKEGWQNIELHGFSDASELAYGAVIYCKSIAITGEFAVKLVSSKSRVAPIKSTTIPRLELCAAVLLAKLMHRVKTSLKLDVSNIYLWSDSMIVLSWIRKEPYHLKTFVANRVSVIQDLTAVEHWRHVSSENNPADLISRGVDPVKLLQSELWFNGPVFLAEKEYPNRDIPTVVIQDFNNELKNSSNDSNDCLYVLNVSTKSFVNELLNISNKYNNIVRVLSFIYRFLGNCRNKGKKVGPLSPEEITNAELTLVKLVQRDEFKKEVKNLQNGRVSSDSQVRNLHPFIDKEGVMRVGGRLANSNLTFDRKFPVILPAKHRLTNLIIECYHQKYMHVGPQSLLYQIRQKFWPINGRDTCRKIVHNCIVCFKAKPVTCQQIMGDLPKERVTETFPFACTGIDFCGPFWIKYKNQRKGIYHKVYVAIFVCFVTRAIHLEIVTELTSQAFLATLKRFFARRGKSSNLFSDNAKNFVGTNMELKKLYTMVNKPDEVLSGYLCSERINWKFLPPRAPNFGGLWEAGVKSFKYHLKRVVGKTRLAYEEFLTVTTQIEGILNSRPLTPLSADIDDLTVLTPAHFLIGRPITSITEPNLTHLETNRLKLYQRATKIVQIVWKKWSNNYLSNLQQRTKWFFEKDNVRLGDLVLVKEDNVAMCNWQIGRLVDLFPGKDNKVRVVNVKTKNGVYKRPITKICILPLES